MGGLIPGGLSVGGSLSRIVSFQGVSIQGVSFQGGLCPGGSLSRWGLYWGCLCPGVSLSGRSPRMVKHRRYAFYWNAFLFGINFAKNCMKMKKTRMHSSRMRTICCSNHLLGVCPGGGVCMGVSALGGVCLVCPGGDTPLWTERLWKSYLSPTSFADDKYRTEWVVRAPHP